MRNFARIAKPLTYLSCGFDNRKRKKRGNRSPGSRSRAELWRWGEEQQSAFNALKECLTTPPVLEYADYTKPFILHTDASYDGLGAVLVRSRADWRGSSRMPVVGCHHLKETTLPKS